MLFVQHNENRTGQDRTGQRGRVLEHNKISSDQDEQKKRTLKCVTSCENGQSTVPHMREHT